MSKSRLEILLAKKRSDISSVKSHLSVTGRLCEELTGQHGIGYCSRHYKTRSDYCKFTNATKEDKTTARIWSTKFNIETVPAHQIQHNNVVNSILKWSRNVIIPKKRYNNFPKITVKYNFKKQPFEDHVYSFGPKSNSWITESHIKWIVRKQVWQRVGRGM